MKQSIAHRARRLAFILGGAAVLLELALLVGVSHARAPEGQFLAGPTNSVSVPVSPTPAVIMLRQLELSL